jgi:hypothetical protein
LFSFLISHGDVSLELAEDVFTQRRPPEDWVDLARLLVAFALGNAKLEINPRSRPSGFYGEFEMEEKIRCLDPIACEKWLAICERTSELLRAAGVSHDVTLTVEDIGKNTEHILRASAILKGELKGISFTAERPSGLEVKSNVRTMFAYHFNCGDNVLAYYFTAMLAPEPNGDRIRWRAVSVDRGKIRSLRDGAREFSSFLRSAEMEEKPEALIDLGSAWGRGGG